MKYFEKAIETDSGVVGNATAVAELRVRLYSAGVDPNSEFTQPGHIILNVFASKSTLSTGKKELGDKVYMITDVSKLANYPALVTELVTLLASDPESPLYGASLGDTQD